MRSWKILLFLLALLGGAAVTTPSVQAAPMVVPITEAQSEALPLVQSARWHGRRHWHRHHGWRRHHWRRHGYGHHRFHHHRRRHGHHHRRLRFY